MAYVPPPYVAPPSTLDPTNVMGRRISAYLIDNWVPIIIAVIVGFVVWSGAATTYAGPTYADNQAYSSACVGRYGSTPDSGISFVPFNCNPSACNVVKFREQLPSSYACISSNNSVDIASDSDTGGAVGLGFLVFGLVPLNLFVLQGLTGASAGKHMLGLRVVRADGAKVGFGWNALRTLLLFIPDQICGGIVGLVTASATKPHRRVGDMAAGTFVVRKASVGQPVVSASSAPVYFSPQPQWAPPPAGGASMPTSQGWSAPTPGGPPASAAGFGTDGVPAAWGIQPQPSSSDFGASGPVREASSQPPGWGAPQATPAPAPQTAPGPQPSADPTQPQWDAARQAYIAWEPTRQRWMQHDTNTNEWRPI